MAASPTGTALPEDSINLNELSLGSSEEGARKPTFDLNAIDEIFLKQVVKKFTVISGGRFYRSCRGAKEFVDRIKPSWTIPDTKLYIAGEEIQALIYVTKITMKICISPKIPYEFCRIEEIIVRGCGTAKLKQFVLPKLEAMNIRQLSVNKMPKEDLQMVLRTAKYSAVHFSDEDYDPNCDLFKDCKHIDIFVCSGYNYTWSCLSKLLRERKTVTFRYNNFQTSMIIVFIKNWLMGESTETLERLTFTLVLVKLRSEDMDDILSQADIRNLTQSCLQTPDGYVLQGRGLGLLRINLDYQNNRIHFQFQ